MRWAFTPKTQKHLFILVLLHFEKCDRVCARVSSIYDILASDILFYFFGRFPVFFFFF